MQAVQRKMNQKYRGLIDDKYKIITDFKMV